MYLIYLNFSLKVLHQKVIESAYETMKEIHVLRNLKILNVENHEMFQKYNLENYIIKILSRKNKYHGFLGKIKKIWLSSQIKNCH